MKIQNPATETTITEVEADTPDTVAAKVAAARAAQPGWAAVPLAEMVGYSSVLSSSSRGRGTFSLRFAHYAEVPQATRARLATRAAS